MGKIMKEHTLVSELKHITQVIEQLVHSGAQVREIRLHGRARPAIVLNRPFNKNLSGKTYAWGKDAQGRHYERQACSVNGVQVQWETETGRSNNIVPFPSPITDKLTCLSNTDALKA